MPHPLLLQRVYRAYAARLVSRLPKPTSGSLSATAVLGGNDWHVRLSEDDISVCCLVISTAEHCQEMVRALARALAAKLEPQELASRWVWWVGGGGESGDCLCVFAAGGPLRGSPRSCACRLLSGHMLLSGRGWMSSRAPGHLTLHFSSTLLPAWPTAISPHTSPSYLCSVDMSEEEDEFQTVITLCLASLLLGIETRLEGALGAMARINWGAMEMVGGWMGGRAGTG